MAKQIEKKSNDLQRNMNPNASDGDVNLFHDL